MIESILINYLAEQLEEIEVAAEVPESPANRFVVVEKTGSSETNHIPTATMAVQSYAESLAEAAKLNERVKEAVKGMIALDSISAVYLNSDYNFTDTETKRYRYQAVFVITYWR